MSWVAAAVVGGAAIGAGASILSSKEQGDAAKEAAGVSAEAAKYQADIQKQIYDQARADQTPWRQTGSTALSSLSNLLGLEVPTGNPGDAVRTIAPDGVTGTNANALTVAPRSGSPMISPATGGAARPADFGSLLRPFSMADYEADPGYAFRQAEGMKAIERSAAARGGALSGGAVRAATRYGQGLASEEYGNAYNRYQTNQNNVFNRLASIAGVGQTANAATGQAGSNYANAITGISQANAVNQGNALLAGGNARASGYLGVGNALGSAPANYLTLSSLRRGSPPTMDGWFG